MGWGDSCTASHTQHRRTIGAIRRSRTARNTTSSPSNEGSTTVDSSPYARDISLQPKNEGLRDSLHRNLVRKKQGTGFNQIERAIHVRRVVPIQSPHKTRSRCDLSRTDIRLRRYLGRGAIIGRFVCDRGRDRFDIARGIRRSQKVPFASNIEHFGINIHLADRHLTIHDLTGNAFDVHTGGLDGQHHHRSSVRSRGVFLGSLRARVRDMLVQRDAQRQVRHVVCLHRARIRQWSRVLERTVWRSGGRRREDLLGGQPNHRN